MGMRTELPDGMSINFGGKKRGGFLRRLGNIVLNLVIIVFLLIGVVFACVVAPEDPALLKFIEKVETGK